MMYIDWDVNISSQDSSDQLGVLHFYQTFIFHCYAATRILYFHDSYSRIHVYGIFTNIYPKNQP